MENFPENLKKLVVLAHKSDRFCKVFGAGKHRYKFNKPTTVEKVREFERESNIKMPESLVKYLTEIGDGGAGVDYGIYSLEKIRTEYESLMVCDSDKTVLDYDNYEEIWADLTEKLENARETRNMQEMDRLFAEIANGFLVIGTAGCTYDYAIICKGRHYGKIAGFDWNLFPDFPPYILCDSLEEWLENYFTKIINKEWTEHRSFYSLK